MNKRSQEFPDKKEMTKLSETNVMKRKDDSEDVEDLDTSNEDIIFKDFTKKDREEQFKFKNPVKQEENFIIATASQKESFAFASQVLEPVTGQIISTDLGRKEFLGACLFYSNRYHLLTCQHVIRDRAHLFACFPLLSQECFFPLEVVDVFEDFDVAILKLSEAPDNVTHELWYMQKAVDVSPEMTTYCGGFDAQFKFRASTGIVVGTYAMESFTLTNETSSGFSGGPCIAHHTDLIGMIQEVSNEKQATKVVSGQVIQILVGRAQRNYPDKNIPSSIRV
jgi:hypothetical protein